MNIGKFSFSEIIRLGFERRNVPFVGGGIFLLLVVYDSLYIATLLLRSRGGQTAVTQVLSIVNILFSLGLALAIILAAYVLAKANITKSKKVEVFKSVKALFWKALGALLVLAVIAAAIALLAYGLGFLVKIPYIGEQLMAILFIPAVVVFGLTTVYLLAGSKLVWAVLVDKPKTSVLTAIQKIWTITNKAPEKLFFNLALSFLPIFFTALSLFLLAGILATVPYLAFGWSFQLTPLLQYTSQLGFFNTFNYAWTLAVEHFMTAAALPTKILIFLGFSAIASYVLSYIINVSAAVYYSIYLDAQ